MILRILWGDGVKKNISKTEVSAELEKLILDLSIKNVVTKNIWNMEFIHDLDIDSVYMFSLVMETEDLFDITISMENLSGVRTPSDFLEVVWQLFSKVQS